MGWRGQGRKGGGGGRAASCRPSSSGAGRGRGRPRAGPAQPAGHSSARRAPGRGEGKWGARARFAGDGPDGGGGDAGHPGGSAPRRRGTLQRGIKPSAPPRSGAGRGRNGEGDGVEPPVEQRSRKARPPSRWRGGQGAPPRWPGSVRHSPARHQAARRRRAPAPQRAAGRGKMIESSRLPLAHRLPLAQSQRDHLAPQIRPAE